MDSRRKACQANKTSYSESREHCVCFWLPYVHLIVRESWNWDIKASQRSFFSTVTSFSFRVMGWCPPAPIYIAQQWVEGHPLSSPGSEADLRLAPQLLSPRAWVFLALDVWKSASLVFKLPCWAPEKSYEMSWLNINDLLFLLLRNTWPSRWLLWGIK